MRISFSANILTCVTVTLVATTAAGPRIQEKRDANPKKDVVPKYENKASGTRNPLASDSCNLAFHLSWFRLHQLAQNHIGFSSFLLGFSSVELLALRKCLEWLKRYKMEGIKFLFLFHLFFLLKWLRGGRCAENIKFIVLEVWLNNI